MKDRKQLNYLKLRNQGDTHDLGLLRAECDEELSMYYVQPEKYVNRAANIDANATFFIGPKGVGKSAILKMVEKEGKQKNIRVVRIQPDDLAFAAISEMKSQSPILQDANRNQWLFKSLWDYVLTLEVIKLEFPDSTRRKSWLSPFFRGECEQAAYRLLRESEKEDETLTGRVLQMIKEVEISAKTPAVTVSGTVKLDDSSSQANRTIPILDLVNTVSKKMRSGLNHKYYVLIDDLDQYWTDDPTQNAFIAALFTSLTHFSRPPCVKAVVALRDNIYRSLPLVERDKAVDRNVRVKWDLESVKQMVEERVCYKYGVNVREIWGGMFPENGFGQMLRYSGGRPRGCIRIAGLAIELAVENGHKCVTDEDLQSAVKAYSMERVSDIGSEALSIYPALDVLIKKMSGWKREFSYDDLVEFFELRVLEVECGEPGAERYTWIAAYKNFMIHLIEVFLKYSVLRIKLGKKDDPADYDFDSPQEITKERWFAIHPAICPALGFGVG